MSHGLRFEVFLQGFCKLYDHILQSGDERAKSILMDMSDKAALFAKLNVVLGIFSSSCFVCYPLLAGLRDLPYGIYIPNFDYRMSPIYEITFVIQAVITFSGSLLYIPFSNLFLSFVMFGIALIRILQHKFSTIAQQSSLDGNSRAENIFDDDVIGKRFKLYIENHKRIIKYVQDVNGLVSTVCLVEIILFGVLLCALLFLVIIVQKTAQLIIACCYIFLIMVQLFTLYYSSNELLEEVKIIGIEMQRNSFKCYLN